MTLVLDAGGVSSLATDRARVRVLIDRGMWPAHVPSVVIVESLTGRNDRDVLAHRLLQGCLVKSVDEPLARRAASLRFQTGRAGTISAVDAVVVSYAENVTSPTILTSDPHDIESLAACSQININVVNV